MSSEPMSSELTIRVEGLSKAYRIYATPTDRLRQAVIPRLRRLIAPILRALGRPVEARAFFHEFWALRGLSFSAARGETVGVIGRNGAGKSTLLQLVCGTLTPTEGEVEVSGRVAALLELGSGFNPEYTGRQNVFLNASVLGLTQEEITARLDSILAFADIGEFIDQPVKTYSSGMAMRLAFAVIAHVDADVLIVDEALAVGDAYFQQKCFRWLREFQKRGTVLFCGHDLGAVVNLCTRAVWLDGGLVRKYGSAKEVGEAYAAYVSSQAMGLAPEPEEPEPEAEAGETAPAPSASTSLRRGAVTFASTEGKDSYGSGLARLTHVSLTLADGTMPPWYEGGEEVLLRLRIQAVEEIRDVITGFFFKDRLGQALIGDNSVTVAEAEPVAMRPGEVGVAEYRFTLPKFAPGDYALTCSVGSGTQHANLQHHWIHEALVIRMQPSDWKGTLLGLQSHAITQISRADPLSIS